MSFLSCIGKKSKKRRLSKNQPLDRAEDDEEYKKKEIKDTDTVPDDKDKVSQKSTSGSKKSPSGSISGSVKDGDVRTENALKSEIDRLDLENKMYKTECEQHDEVVKTHVERIRSLETSAYDMKERLKIAETETARLTIENQRLMTKIVGMEENQAMMSRAELHNMIIQLEEAEQKASSKPATVLSGIRTNPAETFSRKKQSQEERQVSWKLSNTEARLSQSEDENKRLREDLKDMLDTHSDLQVQLLAVSDLKDEDYYRDDAESDVQNTETSTNTAPLNENDVLYKLKKLEWDHCALREEHARLEEEFNHLQKRLEDVEKEKEELMKDRVRFDESERLIEQLKQEEDRQAELRERYVSLEKACQDIDARVENLHKDNKQYKSTNDNLTKQTRNQKNELEKIQNEITKMKKENQRLTEENKKWSQQLQKRKDTVEDSSNVVTENLNKEINDLKRKYEESCKRLKEMTSQTFKQTSQIKSLDITAPPASPTILAEKFRKTLYEDKWTVAHSLLTKKFNKDEKRVVQILGELCTESYLFCKRAARVQMDTLLSSLTSPTANNYRSTGTFNKRNGHTRPLTDQLPEDLRRRLSSYRSRPSEQIIHKGVNDFLGQIDYDRTRHLRTISERELNEMMTYITTCFELCWCMAVQDPPMYLLFKVKHGQDVDPERFDRYRNSGKRSDFVVWPAVFTEENGSCLQKGVMLTLPER